MQHIKIQVAITSDLILIGGSVVALTRLFG